MIRRRHRAGGAAAALLVALLAGVAAGEEPAEALRVRVSEGRAAVFASTNATREAVAWLPPGSELAVRGGLPDEAVWVCVEPPAGTGVWIYRELVRDGVVAADKSRLRAGAGLNFQSLGSLSQGERVEILGRYGDWLKIRPPAGVRFWVLRDQVEPLAVAPPGGLPEEPEEAAAPEVWRDLAQAFTNLAAELAQEQATNRPAAAAAPETPPPELSGARLADVAGQGQTVALSGVLDWGAAGGFAAPYCLVGTRGDDTLPLCHVLAPAAQANALVGVRVEVTGRRWVLAGVALPVLSASRLRPLE